ncbi:unnamed protein product [Heterotrigona itama]|uniref:Uncharacterized protein n=1 Tax=Heterotrigona itama TaxID=395501 RepID=A0A6V7HNS4_9HYME|nr:unnamed protein product [Heterotrigona itama]
MWQPCQIFRLAIMLSSGILTVCTIRHSAQYTHDEGNRKENENEQNSMRICTHQEMARWSTVLSGVFLALTMILSLGKLLMLATGNGNNGDLTEADQWLAEIGLKQYRSLFKTKGQNSFNHISSSIIL